MGFSQISPVINYSTVVVESSFDIAGTVRNFIGFWNSSLGSKIWPVFLEKV